MTTTVPYADTAVSPAILFACQRRSIRSKTARSSSCFGIAKKPLRLADQLPQPERLEDMRAIDCPQLLVGEWGSRHQQGGYAEIERTLRQAQPADAGDYHVDDGNGRPIAMQDGERVPDIRRAGDAEKHSRCPAPPPSFVAAIADETGGFAL